MIYPANLEKGFHIGVTATSAGFGDEIDIRRLDNAIANFEERGYQVVETPNVRAGNNKGRSSDAVVRAKELSVLVNDPKVRVIIAASGGSSWWRCSRMLILKR